VKAEITNRLRKISKDPDLRRDDVKRALVPTLCVGTQTDLAYETALEPKSKGLPRSTWDQENIV